MTDDFQAMLDFDALAAAEKITGKSYKDDDDTSSIGLLLHLKSVERKRDELSLRDDTHFSLPFADLVRIYRELGFETVHEHTFEGRYAHESFVVLWHPDHVVLAAAESFTWGDDAAPTMNNAKLYFNWRPHEPEGVWKLRLSGRYHDDIFIAGLDVREGLRHNWDRLLNEGEFIQPWVEQPFLWLVDYSQTEVKYGDNKYDYKKITNDVLDTLPTEVQEVILHEK